MAESIFEVTGEGEVRRYTGNWSDWASKKREEAAPQKAEKPKEAQQKPVREQKLRFSYKEAREFDMIEGEIMELEEKIESCKAEQMACSSDFVKLQELQAKQEELEEQLMAKEERWLYLTELKEKIDAQQ